MSRLYFMGDADEMVRRRGKVPKGSVVEAWADIAGGGIIAAIEDLPSPDLVDNITRAIVELTNAGIDYSEMTAEMVRGNMQGQNLLPILESPGQIQTVLNLFGQHQGGDFLLRQIRRNLRD